MALASKDVCRENAGSRHGECFGTGHPKWSDQLRKQPVIVFIPSMYSAGARVKRRTFQIQLRHTLNLLRSLPRNVTLAVHTQETPKNLLVLRREYGDMFCGDFIAVFPTKNKY